MTKQEIQQLNERGFAEMKEIKNLEGLRNLEIRYLGRQGLWRKMLQQLEQLSGNERRLLGQLINAGRQNLAKIIAEKKNALEKERAGAQGIDWTLPGKKWPQGHLHLVTMAIAEIEEIFKHLGFVRRCYPEVEWDWYAFEGLNMPAEHPARDEWETFYLQGAGRNKKYGKMVLTPHTSSGQLREMERGKLPIRMINISKCYRRQMDVSHVPMFHQFEGLYINKGVAVTHLKGVLDYFVKQFFGPERKVRLRPFHFQFTEPSFEIDISCGVCGGKGCKLCKAGWLELGGAGMVHPNVLRAGKIDPKKYTGFAFGWGVERTYMMKMGLKIDDIRILYKNDLHFLKQF